MNKRLIIIVILLYSFQSFSQKILSPKESEQLQIEYNNAWKIYEITGDKDNEYETLINWNFFICEVKKYGFYYDDEITFTCCWKKTKKQITFEDSEGKDFTFQIKIWNEQFLILYPKVHPEILLKFKK